MSDLDDDEYEILGGCEPGGLRRVATKDELARLGEAARATGSKGNRVNIRSYDGSRTLDISHELQAWEEAEDAAAACFDERSS